IPFQDADPAGVAWHGNYFRYFDTARCAMLEKIDYSYRQMAESNFLWPVVETRVKFLRAIQYDQLVTVRASLLEWEYRLKIGYTIHDESGQCVTKGYTVQVAVDATTGELCVGTPPVFTERLEAFREDA
ncbi:MAG: acyl-CoA thioesterase, partial [Chlorobiales bacterium]|nr:acyl-CoA thioesterase [Chlorobiales bacterium]